jgi:hypothetical protein
MAAATAGGWACHQSSAYLDQHAHVDFVLIERASGARLLVDVKAQKALRKDGSQQNGLLWLELHGRGPHSAGWLFGGSAAVVAAQVGPRTFVLLERARLAAWAAAQAYRLVSAVRKPGVGPVRESYNRDGAERTTLVKLEEAWAVAGCGVWSRDWAQAAPAAACGQGGGG